MTLWLLLAVWLLFGASWGLLHGWIVPRIGDFRPRLEASASKALGIPVRIGQITARSSGLIPSFELRDVALLDPQGREALRLPRVEGSLSPLSLWSRGFEQLFIDQPDLEIRRAADGKVYVGGLDVSQPDGDSTAAADWFFSQSEFAIRGGTVRWVDEMRRAQPLALTDVDVAVRNGPRSHQLQLDATPPPEWGERFSVRGIFKQPIFSVNAGRWADWSGQLFADFNRVDVSRIQQYASPESLGIVVTSGQGSLRAWADVTDGEIAGITADVALRDVNAQLGKALKPLTLQSVAGRFEGSKRSKGFELKTEALQFTTLDGLKWPGGNVALSYAEADGQSGRKIDLKGDRLDLIALSQIANRVPLGTNTHALIESYAPKGLVESIDLRWQDAARATADAVTASPVALSAAKFSAKGRLTGFAVAALPSPSVLVGTATHPHPGRPGISGASIDFDLTDKGGKAKVNIANGSLDLPGIFESSNVPFDRLTMEVQLKLAEGKVDAQLQNIRFANQDTEGQAQASWRSSNLKPVDTKNHEGVMGVLDLQGSLSRGNGAMVHRYLPLVLPEQVRHYVRDAVVKGDISDVRFKVKGAVDRIPFSDPSLGEFRISAKVKNGLYAYVPKTIQPKDAALWPPLSDLSGELVFDRASLQINHVNGRALGHAGLQMVKGNARIADLMRSTVELEAGLKGPVNDLLGFVNGSPLATLTGNVLANAQVSGQGDYALRLNLPLAAINKTRVAGTISLPGNDVQLMPAVPLLGRLRGQATFNENGFNIGAAQARFLGGDVRFEGGSQTIPRTPVAGTGAGAQGVAGSSAVPANEAGFAFKVQGNLTSDGLRQAKELGLVSRMAVNASGSMNYLATLGVRRGAAEIMVSSNLQGMALSLPAPLKKTTESSLPLRFEQTLVSESLLPGQKLQDQISLTVGSVASVGYLRDISGSEPRVVRGGIGVGLEPGESAPLPDAGVGAHVNLAVVDLDAWEKVLSWPAENARQLGAALPNAAALTARSASSEAMMYLPNLMAIRARELTIEGRKLNHVVVGATREGQNWRANIHAEELNGYVEFRQAGAGGPGRVYARLSRLSLGQSTASEVENILDQQPASIPALDIVVEDLELRGRKLGRIEIDAVNRSAFAASSGSGLREWRLNKFNVILPEAVLTASGNWAAINAQSAGAAANPTRTQAGGGERRRTVMNFKLDIADSGELLKRFGMNDVIRSGRGKMDGQVAWIGSPLSLDYPTMNGQFNVNIESGQFLKADPGIAKLLGVLSLQSLPRRLTLDFKDVFSQGFAFDFVRGDVTISKGVAATNNLQMKGVNAAVLMDGSADIASETQDIKVVVVPEINAGTVSLIATVINPAIGIGTFLAQYFLRRPLIQATTQEFHIDGSWTDPKITKVERKR